MGSFDFTPKHHLFRDRNALLSDYTPEEMVGRDDKLEQYHAALQPAINGSQPDNIFLYGKTGVGKTAGTRFLMERLKEGSHEHEIPIHTTVINCDGADTSYRAAVELANTFRKNKISETGHPRSKVYELMWEGLDSCGGLIIIVLDEIDHLQDDSLLYQLSRARENNNLENTRVTIIGISNDLTYQETLSPKVESSLCERSIHFPAYDAEELRQVLRQREGVAFQDDALDPGVVPLCAAFGTKDSGDARRALDLLLQAGDLAHEEGAQKVAEEHVNRSKKLLQREEITRGIHGLNIHERILLYALSTFAAVQEMPIRSRSLYNRYKQLCTEYDDDPLTSRWMHDHLDELEMLGLVTVDKKNEGSTGGHYKVATLNHRVAVVLEALGDIVKRIGVHRSVEEHLDLISSDLAISSD